MRAYYFGTHQGAGHYLHDQKWNSVWPENPHQGRDKIKWGPLPWRDIDGALVPNWRQGDAALHHKDGWTALAFANYTDDQRPGSNSVFFFEATLTFDEALAAARKHFRHVVERLPFEIRPAAVSSPPSTEGGEG